ncbi:Cyn operon transcriptional activator [Psychrobacter sp. JCM 18903]|uniref:LysR family transcriptional regulator n=1 Tax=Psychrobacter sp. JCM 18903 TaxID=1298610 RepID=UPI000434C017|nr:LysR family transcriptional regulator [Psychrobacter sp. JCM 18903]GAF60404.1 Cyn operon transcriptional activator [Psychrobacter sp. JCM 18903]
MILRHIKYFLAVAKYQSFTQAAASLYVSQPALSQQIKQLEEGLGATLFDRSGRRVTLTDAGDVYARYAHRALQDLEEGRAPSTTCRISVAVRCGLRLRLPLPRICLDL